MLVVDWPVTSPVILTNYIALSILRAILSRREAIPPIRVPLPKAVIVVHLWVCLWIRLTNNDRGSRRLHDYLLRLLWSSRQRRRLLWGDLYLLNPLVVVVLIEEPFPCDDDRQEP